MRKPKYYMLLWAVTFFRKCLAVLQFFNQALMIYFLFFIFLIVKMMFLMSRSDDAQFSVAHRKHWPSGKQELLFSELKDREDISLLLEVKSSFKLVWMETTSPCNSLMGHSLQCRCCCSLVCPIYLLTKSSFDPLERDQSSFRLRTLFNFIRQLVCYCS